MDDKHGDCRERARERELEIRRLRAALERGIAAHNRSCGDCAEVASILRAALAGDAKPEAGACENCGNPLPPRRCGYCGHTAHAEPASASPTMPEGYDRADVTALIADLQAIEDGTEQPPLRDRDHRTRAGVLWRVLASLAGTADQPCEGQ